MKKDTNSKNNGFELDDFWGFSDSKAQNKKGSAKDEDWSFDDLFAAKEKEEAQMLEEQRLAKERAEALEATRRQIEEEFAAKRKADEEAAAAARKADEERERVRRQAEEKANMTQMRRKPNLQQNTEDAPELDEFSDSSSTSLNRLKPEIRLTSVEPSIREENQYADDEYYEDGDYDDDEYEDNEVLYEKYEDDEEYEEYEGDEYEYEDGEYDDGEYEYEDDEYADDEYEYAEEDKDGDYDYDYEAEEEAVPQPAAGYVPVKREEPQPRPKKPYGTEEDWQALEGGGEEEEDGNNKQLIIGIVCGVVVLLLIVIIIWAFSNGGSKEPVNQSSQVEVQKMEITGVITGIDTTNQTILIYDAKSGKEVSLSIKQGSNLGNLVVGDVVDVEYNTVGTNEVIKLVKSESILKLSDVKNAVPNGSIIDINGHTYYIDDKLVCLYQGQAFDVKMISKNTIFNAVALDDHIYTIEITYATGTLKFENLSEYANATMILTPSTGEKLEMVISGNMEPIDIQEGSVEILIKNEEETLYTGKTFISAGKINTLKLPSVKDQKGKVVFNSNIDEEMTILVNGQEYNGSDEVELAYGEYTGIFSAPGYENVELEFKISQPYQKINVEFKENGTLVTISASIWGVSLYVDGAYQGELEDNSISVRLTPGNHSITCTRTGYHDKHQSIMILEGMEDQMLYFSGFEPLESSSSTPTQESSTPTQESSTPTQESSTPTQESSTTPEESSTPNQEEPSNSTEDPGAATSDSGSTGE